MLDSNSSPTHLDNEFDLSAPEPSSIKFILRNPCLPNYLKTAAISHVCERLIDESEISRLTETDKLEKNDPATINRLEIRKKALTEHLGATLTCVLIRLPGVSYTIEIDRTTDSIIHWEWQES